MRYFVYKTTCLPTLKYYIGVHSEVRQSDGYIGFGVCSDGTAISLKKKGVKSAFIDSVVKYGYKNFKREIIKEFNTKEEAYDYEKLLVNNDLLKDKACLNIRLGGFGGRILSACKPTKIMECSTGRIFEFESKSDCEAFLGVKNISGKKRFLKNSYVLYGFNEPISLKKPNEDPIFFHDIYVASSYTKLGIFDLRRLLNKSRKSSKGWFLSDFDFKSSFYKNAKKIRKHGLQ